MSPRLCIYERWTCRFKLPRDFNLRHTHRPYIQLYRLFEKFNLASHNSTEAEALAKSRGWSQCPRGETCSTGACCGDKCAGTARISGTNTQPSRFGSSEAWDSSGCVCHSWSIFSIYVWSTTANTRDSLAYKLPAALDRQFGSGTET
jgi:hypothetical protein